MESTSLLAEEIAPPRLPRTLQGTAKTQAQARRAQAGTTCRHQGRGQHGRHVGRRYRATSRRHRLSQGGLQGTCPPQAGAEQEVPVRAKMDEIQGTATAQFTINRNGEAVVFSVIKNSGQSTLDDEAKALLRRVYPFHQFPDALTEPSMAL
ncbi:MAG: energy transducer TonB, partial [Deltaproteobacteria bacterium]|nr:energy transducer TonB [Deltaproteobacteria bacterium]